MKFQTIQKLLLITLITQQLKSIETIQQLCLKESDINFQEKFNQPNIESLLENSKQSGEGQFGKVYIIDYNSKSLQTTIKRALKQIKITKKSTQESIAKEISFIREFSELDSSRFLEFFGCFYIKRNSENSVYIITEVLDKELFDERTTVSDLDRLERFQVYLGLVNDVKDFHNNFQRKYLDGGSYVHLDIKLENMMILRDDHGGFRIKHIDYGIMEAKGTSIKLRGTPGYIHPDFFQKAKLKKAVADPKYDVYALIISIAKLEYGLGYASVSEECELKFPKSCLDELKLNIFKGYCMKYQIQPSSKGYQELISIAEGTSKCLNIICIIYRNMRMKLEDSDDIEGLYQSLKFVIDKQLAKINQIL